MTQLRERTVHSEVPGWVCTKIDPTEHDSTPHFKFDKLVGRGRLTILSVSEGYSMWDLMFKHKEFGTKTMKRIRIMSDKELRQAALDLMQWYLKGCPDESNTD